MWVNIMHGLFAVGLTAIIWLSVSLWFWYDKRRLLSIQQRVIDDLLAIDDKLEYKVIDNLLTHDEVKLLLCFNIDWRLPNNDEIFAITNLYNNRTDIPRGRFIWISNTKADIPEKYYVGSIPLIDAKRSSIIWHEALMGRHSYHLYYEIPVAASDRLSCVIVRNKNIDNID